jgi:acyl-CoA thioesterase YciA
MKSTLTSALLRSVIACSPPGRGYAPPGNAIYPPAVSTPPDKDPVIRTIAMPTDTNPSGDIFGGWLLAQMDMAAGSAAGRRARGRCATVALDAMEFKRPVFVGDEVTFYATILKVGRTSMRIHVEAWRRPRFAVEHEQVTSGVFTMVAIDENRKPRPVPA